MKYFFLFIAVFLATATIQAQQVILLYDGVVPNSKPAKDSEAVIPVKDDKPRIARVTKPTLTVYRPAKGKANGTAVIICPGGGYARLSIDKEGYDVGQALAEMGITAFVLKYRLPTDELMVDKSIGPIQDAQRAIQMLRQRAGEFEIDPGKVGIMGFSAGGHLAATAGTHFLQSFIDAIPGISLRPDFMVLLYPVISFSDSLGHTGSRHNLIGKDASAAMVREFSNELHVTAETPPTFIVQAENDATVKVENSLVFYAALSKNKVPAELHLYPQGGHGFGMYNKTTPDKWMDRLQNWLQMNGWIK